MWPPFLGKLMEYLPGCDSSIGEIDDGDEGNRPSVPTHMFSEKLIPVLADLCVQAPAAVKYDVFPDIIHVLGSTPLSLRCNDGAFSHGRRMPSSFKPKVGMVFEKLEDGISFYKNYTLLAGFDIRMGTSTKSPDGVNESVGGYNNIGATAIDFKNFKRDLKAYVAGGDAQMIIDKMFRRQETCPAFRFAYDVDETDQLT
ncbi:unnamed protein product [Cuscuta campestris]|uniref:Uncharacterized protein n=1 Tax=Cuscuta campestris TaxID=132261 RepID=A0A484L3J8_9ASTE|nr:unnamed protein product [Cuscuta campestris]